MNASNKTLEQWAERVAPTLNADHWRFVEDPERHAVDLRPWSEMAEAGAVQNGDVAPETTDKGRALLAYRDKVVAAIRAVPSLRLVLLAVIDGDNERINAVLRQRRLVVRDWGREIARAVEGRDR